MRYRYILLDADNTLFDFDACEKEAFFAALNEFSVSSTDAMYARYSEINKACWLALERGELSRQELKTKRFEELIDEYDLPCTPNALAERYLEHLSSLGILLPGAQEFVQELSRIAEIHIITNGLQNVQEGRFRTSPLTPYLKNIFISEKIGAQKPDKLFFERVSDAIDGFDAKDAVVIGDSLTSDIKGANNAGIDCIWFNPKGCARGNEKIDYEVSSYGQILAILKQGDIHEN